LDLHVIGCHGGETPSHRTSAFVVDERIAIDAGSLTSGLELKAQCALEAVLVSHAHLDHVRDLATIADNRLQNGAAPLVVAATSATIATLRKHFFNDLLWPDFSRLPAVRRPAIRYHELKLERASLIAGYEVRAIPVSHTIDTCGFTVRASGAKGDGGGAVLAYSGDTGPTERLWEVLRETERLKALLMEVSFPNREASLARKSGHHTPETLAKDMRKLGDKLAADLPTLLYHIKPSFQSLVERECGRLKKLNLTVCALGDHFVL
jgi:3',5'-cyclic-nucleotide phosphodiesterase